MAYSLPLTDVVASFPGDLKRHGNSRVVTIPPKYHSSRYEVLIVVKEKSA